MACLDSRVSDSGIRWRGFRFCEAKFSVHVEVAMTTSLFLCLPKAMEELAYRNTRKLAILISAYLDAKTPDSR